jgi:hypothetical protein
MSGSDYPEFGFGDGDSHISEGKNDRFKAKAGETYRASFVWWPTADGRPNLDAPSPRFVGLNRLYIEGVGYVINHGPDFERLAGTPQKPTVATVIAIWPTDRKGNLDKARFAAGEVDVKAWVFARSTYDQLARRHDEFPLGQHDLTITCTDAQFQKVDVSPCRDSYFRRVLESDKLNPVADALIAKTSQILGLNTKGEAAGLRNAIARDMTIEQIRAKLGQGPSAAAMKAVAQTTAEVDAMLDGLLE